jgi:glycogen synthase
MLTWSFPPGEAGGVAAQVDGLASALAAAGHDVVVVTPSGSHPSTQRRSDDTTAAGVRVVRTPVDMPWLPDSRVIGGRASGNHALVASTAVLGDWRPDVVHAHDWEVAWAADTLATLAGAPLVTTFHGTERSRHGGHLPAGDSGDINAIEWWLAFRSRRVLTSTRLMVREIVSGFELDPDVVRRIPNGIDPTWWRHEGDPRADGPPLVFTWGRVQYEKGFQVLARAMAGVRQRRPDVECMIAGRGSYLPELQSQIDIAGVGDLVQLPGYLPDDQLRAVIHRSTCVVIPSLYEPFGVVALEALAAGAPLVVAETGGLAELVGGTGSALLFEPGNADQLADRILQVIGDAELAATMRARGADLIDATYSWQAIAMRTLDVYTDAGARTVNVR